MAKNTSAKSKAIVQDEKLAREYLPTVGPINQDVGATASWQMRSVHRIKQ